MQVQNEQQAQAETQTAREMVRIAKQMIDAPDGDFRMVAALLAQTCLSLIEILESEMKHSAAMIERRAERVLSYR